MPSPATTVTASAARSKQHAQRILSTHPRVTTNQCCASRPSPLQQQQLLAITTRRQCSVRARSRRALLASPLKGRCTVFSSRLRASMYLLHHGHHSRLPSEHEGWLHYAVELSSCCPQLVMRTYEIIDCSLPVLVYLKAWATAKKNLLILHSVAAVNLLYLSRYCFEVS